MASKLYNMDQQYKTKQKMINYINEPEFMLTPSQIELFNEFKVDSLIRCCSVYIDWYEACPKIYNNYISIVLPLIIKYNKNDKYEDIKGLFTKIFSILPLDIIKQIIDNYNSLPIDKRIIQAIFLNPDNKVLEYVLKNKELSYLTNVQMLSYFSLYPSRMEEFYDILFTKHCGKYLFRGNITHTEYYTDKKYYDEMFKINGNLIDKYIKLFNDIGIKVYYSIPSEPTLHITFSNICITRDNYGFDNYLDYSNKESSISDQTLENFKNMSSPKKLSDCIDTYINNYNECPKVYYNYIVAAYYYLMEYQFGKVYNSSMHKNSVNSLNSVSQPFNDITSKIIKNLPSDIVKYCLNINTLYPAYLDVEVLAFTKNIDTIKYILSKYVIKYDTHLKFISNVITKNKWPGKQIKLLSKVYNSLVDVNYGYVCLATYFISCHNITNYEKNYMSSIGFTFENVSLSEPGKQAIMLRKSQVPCMITKNGVNYISVCDINKKLEKYKKGYNVVFTSLLNQYAIYKYIEEEKVTTWVSLISYTSKQVTEKLYKTITIISN